MINNNNNVNIVNVNYDDTFQALDWVYKNKFNSMSINDKYEYLQMFNTYLKNTIYEILLKNKTNEKEEYIRKLCRYVIKYLLPSTNKIIEYFNDKKSGKNTSSASSFILTDKELILFNNVLDLEDDLFAIACLRSMTHLALYLERDDDLDQKVWCYILNDVMGGIFYYANQMILNNKYQNLFKQCPTGYGKCFSLDSDILTDKGYKKIKDIKVGDHVYSMKNNKPVLRKILNIWYSEKNQYKIKARNGSEIVVSPEHRMLTQRGYVKAQDLKTEDYFLEFKNNDFINCQIIEIEKIDEKIQMADIEVEETHNFILNGFVSHNSKSDCVIISFILGYDPSASIMKVVGNPRLVGEITENVVKMIQSPRFCKVFKNYEELINKNGNKEDIFDSISRKDGVFKIKGSKKARSFLCVNKDTAIDGTRYDYQFFDDVTQSKDRERVDRHMADRNNFTSQWKKRASSEFLTKRFFTGTAYHREDFLSYTKKYFLHNDQPIKDIDTAGFRWSKFVKLSKDKKTVYISVPKLANLDLGEEMCYCTFPQKYSKQEALNMLHGSLGSRREFFAMEQQEPLPPESLAFDYAYLNKYSRLPTDIIERKAKSKIIIDPSRKGGDNFAGLIFEQSSIENTNKWYLTSCYYEKTSSKVALPEIADLIVDHKVDIIYLETNIDCSQLLEIELKKRGYVNYELKEFYSSQKKSEKIAEERDNIRDDIIFPIQGMYSPESAMGRCMMDIVSYSFETNNKHDDSIDCCAMFTKQEKSQNQNTIEFLDIDFSLYR